MIKISDSRTPVLDLSNCIVCSSSYCSICYIILTAEGGNLFAYFHKSHILYEIYKFDLESYCGTAQIKLNLKQSSPALYLRPNNSPKFHFDLILISEATNRN